MKTIMSILPENAANLFGTKKKVKISGHTIRYFYSKMDQCIKYCIFRGKGTGRQIAGTNIFEEAILFVNSDTEYRMILNSDGIEGGGWFFRGTDKMIFSNHPFLSGFKFKN